MKVLKGIFYTFLTAVLLLFFYFFFGGAICNDIKASRIEKEYAKMELPEKTRRVSTVSYVGNTSGMGNFIEIWAGMVVYSELSAEELEEFYDGYYVAELPIGVETTEWQKLNDSTFPADISKQSLYKCGLRIHPFGHFTFNAGCDIC